MATRHSTRRQQSSRARSHPKSHSAPAIPTQKEAASAQIRQARSAGQAAPKKKRKATVPPDLDEILGRFAESLALVETSYAVLDAAQEDWNRKLSQVGCPAVHTLGHGIKALSRVYSEVDLAFLALS